MSAPQQHEPPVYACAAGAVLHGHAGDTLEPAVLLHTFLPPLVRDRLDGAATRVDVHAGAVAGTATVRLLVDNQSLAWQLPLAPLVAGLPGQPGDDGRMVLLALVDSEPPPQFWARPVDCEQVAAELQLPVADLVEALRGRLTPWLAEDLEILLHDDAHEHAVDLSPAQTLADAVLAHYRGDLRAEVATSRLVRALELAPETYSVELGARLALALATAVRRAGDLGIAAVREQTGPFESEALRLLEVVPARLADTPPAEDTEVVMLLLLEGQDRDEVIRAAVSTTARLARLAVGPDLPDTSVLRALSMVDDAALGRLALLWVQLGAAVLEAAGSQDVVADVLAAARGEGPPGESWLRGTVAAVRDVALEAAGRTRARLAGATAAVEQLLDAPEGAGDAGAALTAALELARVAQARGGAGPATWLRVPPFAAASAVGGWLASGTGTAATALDLLDGLLETDVEAVDVLEACVCATSQLLARVEPYDDEPADRMAGLVQDLLASVPGGPRGARWLLVAALREAPHHDAAAQDLSRYLPDGPAVDADRAAERAGRAGVLAATVAVLQALGTVLGDAADTPPEEVLALLLPSALQEHGLLLGSE